MAVIAKGAVEAGALRSYEVTPEEVGLRRTVGLADRLDRVGRRREIDRHPQHRHRRLGRQHAGQMRRTSRTRNDGLHAAGCRLFCEGEHVVGHAVGGDDSSFAWHRVLGE